MNRFIRKIWLPIFLLTFSLYTQADSFNITRELTDNEITKVNRRIKIISWDPWNVSSNIHKAHEDLNLFERLASWILEIEDIMDYLVLVVKFLSQLWLVVWMIFITYAWYQYIISVFNWWKAPSNTVKNAIIWVIIVIFSYAIMRFLTSIIWLT
jgi:hypothetical protein